MKIRKKIVKTMPSWRKGGYLIQKSRFEHTSDHYPKMFLVAQELDTPATLVNRGLSKDDNDDGVFHYLPLRNNDVK